MKNNANPEPISPQPAEPDASTADFDTTEIKQTFDKLPSLNTAASPKKQLNTPVYAIIALTVIGLAVAFLYTVLRKHV